MRSRHAAGEGAQRDFQTAGLNGVFGYFCRRGQKYPAPGRGISPWTIRREGVPRLWASAPTHGYRWSFRRGRCPHRPVCHGAAAAYLSLRHGEAVTPQLRFAAQPSVRTGPPHRGRRGVLRARGRGGRIPTPVCGLARNDTAARCLVGQGRPPLRTNSSAVFPLLCGGGFSCQESKMRATKTGADVV